MPRTFYVLMETELVCETLFSFFFYNGCWISPETEWLSIYSEIFVGKICMICEVCVVGISSIYFFTIKQNSLRTLEKMFLVKQVITSPCSPSRFIEIKIKLNLLKFKMLCFIWKRKDYKMLWACKTD